MDVAAAVFLHEEEMKREAEREKRDREFWVTMFGGQAESDGSQMFTSAEDIKFATFDRSRAERW
jgi:hypothetical protein